MVFAARLVAYEPGGARLDDALLDGVSWDASFPLNDVSALTLAYPQVLDAAGLGDGPVEIAVEVSAGGPWVEPANGRYLSAEMSADLTQDLDVPSFTFRGLGSLLERAFILAPAFNSGKPYDSDGKRNFLSATVGQLVASVVSEARSKYSSMLSGVTLDFTATHDSGGKPWDRMVSIAYEPDTDLLRILDDLVSRGDCDWQMQGRKLQVFNADSQAVTHSFGLDLVDADGAPVRATWENLATHVVVEGGEEKRWERSVPGAVVPYGARVIRIGNDSITTSGTANDLIDRQVQQVRAARREYTRSLAVLDPAPLVAYKPGDWVSADVGVGFQSVRVFELGLGYQDGLISARVTLNDRFVDAAVRDAKRLQGISHGATQLLGDGSIPSRADKAQPAAPTGVTVNSLGYWNGPVPLSSVDVSWQAVTAGTNGLAIGVDYYEVECSGLRHSGITGLTTGFDSLQPSRIYEVRVRAISSTGIVGRWSARKEVLTAFPLPQLDPPTVPVAKTGLGSISLTWDGKLQGDLNGGAPYKPPLHFSHVVVELRATSTTVWTRYSRDHGFVHTNLDAGEQYRARLVAVDMLDNESEPGPDVLITVESLVQDALDHANQVAEDLLAEKARVDGELTPVKTSLSELTTTTIPALDTRLTTAQSTADGAVTDLTSIFDDVLIKGAGGSIRLRDSTVTAPNIVASEALSAKVAQFLSVETGSIVWDNAAGNQAFINSLIGEDAFLTRLLTSQLTVAPDNLFQAWWAVNAEMAALWPDEVKYSPNEAWRPPGLTGCLYATETATTNAPGEPVQVTSGEQIEFEFWIRANAAGSRMYVEFRDQDSELIPRGAWSNPQGVGNYPIGDLAVQPSWQQYVMTLTVPAGVTSLSAGRVYWNHTNGVMATQGLVMRARRKVGAVLIEDGAVTTPKLAVGAVEADKIAVGALDAFQITSPLIQSVSTANRGIKWNGNQFVAYNNSGVEMIRLEGNTGEITGMTITGGTVRTAVSGQRIQMVSAGDLYAYSSSNVEVLRLQSSDSNGGSSYFYGPTNSGYRSYLRLGVGTIDSTTTPQAWLGFSGGDRASQMWVHGNGAFYLGGTRGRISLTNSSGELRLLAGGDTNLLGIYGVPTTTSTGQPLTTIVGGSLRSVYINTSLAAYKLDVEDLSAGDPYKVLALRPRDWWDRTAMDQFADGLEADLLRGAGEEVPEKLRIREEMVLPHRVPGFVAEEVAAAIPELATRDGEGNLTGVAYDRVPAYLLVALKALKAEVEDIKQQIGV